MAQYTSGFSGTLTKKEYASEQSANALFTCMKDIQFLKDILKRKKIYPRYYKEDIEYLNLPGLSGIAYPMKCFCDIFLTKLEKHMHSYGKYGIALTKEWGLSNKIQPIQYINENSFLFKSIQKLYENRYASNSKLDYQDLFHNILGFIKPISGKMPKENSVITKNFHDEKEWRYIPEISPKARNYFPFIEESYIINNGTLLNQKSNEFFIKDKYGLKITDKDIKYIIISSEEEREPFIDFILKECHFKRKEKYNLISKLIIFNEIKGDW